MDEVEPGNSEVTVESQVLWLLFLVYFASNNNHALITTDMLVSDVTVYMPV